MENRSDILESNPQRPGHPASSGGGGASDRGGFGAGGAAPSRSSPSGDAGASPSRAGTALPLSSGGGGSSDLETLVWGQLRDCYDPEIPLNIVDLGLVYEVCVQGGQANIKMTLTSPGCHLGGQIAGTVQEKLLALDQIEEANVELVWDPPWHQSMISAQGRKTLGLEAS